MKGLSQITAAVLLLAVGVSVVSIYAEWAPDFATQTAENVANQTNNEIKCSNAALSVEDPLYDRTGEVVDLTVENEGTIRFSGDIIIGVFNSSLQTGRTTVTELEVGEERQISIDSSRIPENLVLSSTECPELKVTEDQIDVQK